MSDLHHEYSPSKAARWMNCAGAVQMEKDFEDETSEAAAEGTAAHMLAEACLKAGVKAETFIGETFNTYLVTDDMARFVQAYLDNLDEYSESFTCD